jgi:hypothetical protein
MEENKKKINNDKSNIRTPILWLKSKNIKRGTQTKFSLNFKKGDLIENKTNSNFNNVKETEKKSKLNNDVSVICNLDFDNINISISEESKNNFYLQINEDDMCNQKEIDVDLISNLKYNKTKINWKCGEILSTDPFSIVYKALNIENGSIFIVEKYLTMDANKIKIIQEEVEIFKTLNHINIIKFLGTETINEYFHVHLEYIPGGVLNNLLEKFGPLNEKLIKLYMKQILNGLKYLNDAHIEHKNINSENILIDTNGIIKLIGFGSSGQHCENINKNFSVYDFQFIAIGCLVIEMFTGINPICGFKKFCSNEIRIPENVSGNCKDFIILCFSRETNTHVDIETLLKHPFLY